MQKRTIFVVMFLFTLALAASTSALLQDDWEIPCSPAEPCDQDLCDDFGEGGECFCNDAGLCAERDLPPQNQTNQTNSTNITINAQQANNLDEELEANAAIVAAVQQRVNGIESRVATLEGQMSSANTRIQELQQEDVAIRALISNIDIPELENSVGAAVAAQAALQDDVTQLQSNLEAVEQDLQAQESFTFFLKVIMVFLIIAVVGVIIFYFITKSRSSVSPQIQDYITNQIKKGKKFTHIRQALQKSGWRLADIVNAYKQTLRRNYQNFMQGKSSQPANHPTQHKNKIVFITIISFVVFGGIFFILSNVTGQAIHYQENFAHDQIFECTPPHILAENGGCCLDTNNNTVCDTTEGYTKEKATVSADTCTDHNQCAGPDFCVDGTCQRFQITNLYNYTDCGVSSCNVKNIVIRTSEGETYPIYGKGGSYTAAGAVEWKVLPIPNYCDGNDITIPIEIIKKDLVCRDEQYEIIPCTPSLKGKIEVIEREIITLRKGQTSKHITHPNPDINARLR